MVDLKTVSKVLNIVLSHNQSNTISLNLIVLICGGGDGVASFDVQAIETSYFLRHIR